MQELLLMQKRRGDGSRSAGQVCMEEKVAGEVQELCRQVKGKAG